MPIYTLADIMLESLVFESKIQAGETSYIAQFKGSDGKNAKALHEQFKKVVLDPLRTLLRNDPDEAQRYLPRPDLSAKGMLTLSLTQRQHALYQLKKSQLSVKEPPRHYLSYAFFYPYPLPDDKYLYVCAIPNDDFRSLDVDICQRIRIKIRNNKELFDQYFPSVSESNLFSVAENNKGRFLIAKFIKTSDDYQRWLQFMIERLENAHIHNANEESRQKDAPLGFFSKENCQKLQIETNARFSGQSIQLYHLTEASKFFADFDKFTLNPYEKRYELNMKGYSLKQLQVYKREIQRFLSDQDIPSYVLIDEQVNSLYLSGEDWERCQRGLGNILVLRVSQMHSTVENITFSRYNLPNSKKLYIHITGNSSKLNSFNKKFKLKEPAVMCSYHHYLLLVLTESAFTELLSLEDYTMPTKTARENNRSLLNTLCQQADFFVPADIDLRAYLDATKDGSLERFFNYIQKNISQVEKQDRARFCQKIVEFLGEMDRPRACPGRMASRYDSLVQWCHQTINTHLKTLSAQLNLENYCKLLRSAFKQSEQMVTDYKELHLPFSFNASRGQIVVESFDREGAGVPIIISIKNGVVTLEHPVRTTAKDIAPRILETLAWQLIKLVVAVTYANAVIYAQQKLHCPFIQIGAPELLPSASADVAAEPMVTSVETVVSFTESILLKTVKKKTQDFSSEEAEKHQAICAAHLQSRGGLVIKSAAEEIQNATNIAEIIAATEKYDEHIVIADAPKKEIGSDFLLFANREPLVIAKDEIICFYGQAVVTYRDLTDKLVQQGKLFNSDLVGLDGPIHAGRVLCVNRDLIDEPAPGHYINHTSNESQINAYLNPVKDDHGNVVGLVFRAKEQMKIAAGTGTRILISYGDNEERLQRVHGIPIGAKDTARTTGITIDQLSGIRRINSNIEQMAWELLRAKSVAAVKPMLDASEVRRQEESIIAERVAEEMRKKGISPQSFAGQMAHSDIEARIRAELKRKVATASSGIDKKTKVEASVMPVSSQLVKPQQSDGAATAKPSVKRRIMNPNRQPPSTLFVPPPPTGTEKTEGIQMVMGSRA